MNNDEILRRMLDKQEVMNSDIGEIKVDLQYHVKRTNLLEELVNDNKDEVHALLKKIDAEIQPVKSHVALVNSVLKMLGALSVLVGIISGILKIISYFS